MYPEQYSICCTGCLKFEYIKKNRMCFILTGTPICIYTYFQKFPGMHIDVLHDFEMRPGTRKPKILVQTAGHVSGAAYFYQKGYVSTSHWPEHKVLTND